jgi:hypothetical protein
MKKQIKKKKQLKLNQTRRIKMNSKVTKFISTYLLSILMVGLGVGIFIINPPFLSAATKSGTTSESTSSAAQLDEDTQGAIEELKKRIEKNSDKVKGVINSLLYKHKGMVGEVQRVTEETVTIRTQEGTTILPINDDVEISRQDKNIAVDDVAIGNWVTVMGLEKDTNFSPRFIEISVDSLRPKPQVVRLSVITEISNTLLTLMPRSSNETIKATLTKSTKFEDADGEAASLKDFEADMHVLLVGWETDSGVEVVRIRSLASLKRSL